MLLLETVALLNEGPIVEQKDYERQGGIEVFGTAGDLTIFATSWMVAEAIVAKNKLADQGFDIGVVSISDLKAPLPSHVREIIGRSGNVMVADNDWRYCGFGAELASQIYETHFDILRKPIMRLGFEDTHCPTARNLENEFYCDANDIIEAVNGMFGADYEKVDEITFQPRKQV